MQVLKQAYQAECLIRKSQLHTVGTRFPFKDHVVITAENIERQNDNDIFTNSYRIDVVVKCENNIEAKKLNVALRDYFAKDMMLPLHVGVFQKPFLKEGQKARKYFSYSSISAKELLALLPKYEADKALKYVVGASPVESNVISNGFDLTYSIVDYTMDSRVFTLEDAKKSRIEIKSDIYKLVLSTSSIFEDEEGNQLDELIDFEIACDSESEIEELALLIQKNKQNGVVFTCKGRFPTAQKDFFAVPLAKRASELIQSFSKPLPEPKKAS